MTYIKIDSHKNKISKDIFLTDVYLNFSHALKTNMLVFFNNIHELSLTDKENTQELKSVEVHKLNLLSSYLRTIKSTFIQFHNREHNYFEKKITNALPNKQNQNAFNNSELNEKYIQNSLIHKYEKINIKVLFEFKQQLSLVYKDSIDSQKLTLSPFVVVSSFAKSIRLLHLSYEVKQIMYSSFEKCVLEQLNKIYEDISLYYFKTSSIEKKQSEEIVENYTKKTYTNNQIFYALDRVQNNLAIKEPLQATSLFLKQLKAIEKLELNHVDKDKLNLITLLFQQIENDKYLDKSIKKTLARLQFSYIRLVFLDDDLIQNDQHPAKLLLVEISNTSRSWLPEKDREGEFLKQLKLFISHFINTATAHQSTDNDFLHKQLKLFRKLSEECVGLLKLSNHHNNAEDGRNKIITAMKTIDALLNHKTEEFDNTPEYIEKILRTPWKNLLVLLLVRHSNSSNRYLRMINFIDELFALLVPNEVTNLFKKNTDSVCETFEHGLRLIAYQDNEITIQSLELKEFILNHQKLLSKKKSNSFSNEIITKIHSSISLFNKSNKKQNKPEKVSINKYLLDLSNEDKHLVRPVTYGKWLEFKHSNGKSIQAQLSWINPKTGRYLFVNNSGLKITDKSAQQLADGIREKDIIIK